jgi:hypothetical protein
MVGEPKKLFLLASSSVAIKISSIDPLIRFSSSTFRIASSALSLAAQSGV